MNGLHVDFYTVRPGFPVDFGVFPGAVLHFYRDLVTVGMVRLFPDKVLDKMFLFSGVFRFLPRKETW
jgi:hypothetical protein